MKLIKRTLLVLGSCALGFACGSPAPVIQHRLSMEMLHTSPPEVRASVAEAHEKHYRAQLNLAHMHFLLKDVEYEFKMAKTEKGMAKQSMKMEKIKGERNKYAYKTKLMDAAKSAMRGHDKRSSALDDRIRYLKAQKKYLAKGVAHAKANVDHTEARFELAKAKLAQERKTIPKGFKLAKFVAQEKKAGKIAGQKAQKLKSAQGDAKAKKQLWNKADKATKARAQ